MQALLLVAHGSRRESSNSEIRNLAARLRKMKSDFTLVEAAFLDLEEPSIPQGLRQLAKAGARKVVIVPYFLSAGRHVVTDIPREVDKARADTAGVEVQIAPYLGSAKGIAKLLLKQARAGAE